MKSPFVVGVLVVLGALATAVPILAAAGPETGVAAERVAAVWEEHEMVFQYQDFTTVFSCEGLKSKVRQILRELGVRDDLVVRSYGCASSPFEPSPIASVKLSFAALRPVPDGFEGETVAASWDEVDLSRKGTGFLERGDCVLVERFRDVVLPAFAHEIVRDRTTCVPHSLSGTAPNLRVRVLRPVP